jgi:DNA invertase Pin-like site-specific DNA recombinase
MLGIDTTTPAGRFLFHVIAAMDEMTADLISEGTLEAPAAGEPGGIASLPLPCGDRTPPCRTGAPYRLQAL